MQSVNIRDDFGGTIKAARQSMGIKQLQLAQQLRISTRYLKAIENSGRIPSYDLFVKIITALEIRADFSIYPEHAEQPSNVFILHGENH